VELYGYGDGFTTYQHLIEKWGVWIIIAKSLTPIPFKIMAIAAGVAAMSPSAFLASAAGIDAVPPAETRGRGGDRGLGSKSESCLFVCHVSHSLL
jgi:hypothetical protein